MNPDGLLNFGARASAAMVLGQVPGKFPISAPKELITTIRKTFIADHYNDVIMSAMASQITSVSSVCSTVGSGADQRKHQSSASLSFARGIHRWPVNSSHKWPVAQKIFPFDDVIMVMNTYISYISTIKKVMFGWNKNIKWCHSLCRYAVMCIYYLSIYNFYPESHARELIAMICRHWRKGQLNTKNVQF